MVPYPKSAVIYPIFHLNGPISQIRHDLSHISICEWSHIPNPLPGPVQEGWDFSVNRERALLMPREWGQNSSCATHPKPMGSVQSIQTFGICSVHPKPMELVQSILNLWDLCDPPQTYGICAIQTYGTCTIHPKPSLGFVGSIPNLWDLCSPSQTRNSVMWRIFLPSLPGPPCDSRAAVAAPVPRGGDPDPNANPNPCLGRGQGPQCPQRALGVSKVLSVSPRLQ